MLTITPPYSILPHVHSHSGARTRNENWGVRRDWWINEVSIAKVSELNVELDSQVAYNNP